MHTPRTNTWPTRLPLLVLSLVVGVFTLGTAAPFVASVPMTLLLVASCLATRARGVETGLVVPAGVLVAVLAVLSPLQLVMMALDGLPVVAPIAVVGSCAASVVLSALRPGWFAAHLVLQGSVLVMMVRSIAPEGDVRVLVEQSVAGLLDGRNPYSMTFPNPYTAQETAEFWSPEFVSGDRINVGFPYLPGALLGDVPGHLVGDVRYAGVAAVLVATVLAWRLTSDVVGRALVAALPTCLLSMTTVLGYWVEPLMLLGVALLAWSVARGRRDLGAVALTVLLTVKQYAIVLLPLEALIRRRLGLRTLLIGAGCAVFLVVTFFLLAPADFWRSVVLLHFNQPFRPDSTSLSVDLVGAGVPLPEWVMAAASLGTGLAVAWWVRTTAGPSATWTALGIGLALLSTVLLSKAGHVNYYFVIHGCLVIGLASWPGELGSSPDRPGTCKGEAVLVEGD